MAGASSEFSPPLIPQKSTSLTSAWRPSTNAPSTPGVALMAARAEGGALIAKPWKT